MLKTIFYIFYFVKGCGSFGLNVLFGNTFHKSWSIFCNFFIVFITYFENFGFRDQAFFFYFFQKYVSCEKGFQDSSCYDLFSSFLLESRFPNTGVSCVVFKNFASRLERRQFLVFSKWFYNILGFGEIILYA